MKRGVFLAMCAAMLVGTTVLSACGSEETNTPETGIMEETGETQEGGEAQENGENGETQEGEESSETSSAAEEHGEITTATEALEALERGNQAFVAGEVNVDVSSSLRQELSEHGQKPYAIVITCSDSRVPPELLFHANLGDLFVIRTAGNVVADFEVGSVEYAAEHLGSPLVLVMGHTQCGAVTAAVEGHGEGDIEDIIKAIEPSVDHAERLLGKENTEEVIALATDLNVDNSIDILRESNILKHLEEEGKLKIYGALYNIDSGKVTILDE